MNSNKHRFPPCDAPRFPERGHSIFPSVRSSKSATSTPALTAPVWSLTGPRKCTTQPHSSLASPRLKTSLTTHHYFEERKHILWILHQIINLFLESGQTGRERTQNAKLLPRGNLEMVNPEVSGTPTLTRLLRDGPLSSSTPVR